MKENKNLELRAYSLSLYQLSEKAGIIQGSHAVTEVGAEFGMEKGTLYHNWACNHKTIIHLNGGTSTMLTESIQKLKNFGLDVAEFREPDLYNVITACGFILDERVYDEEKYPSFKEFAKWVIRDEDILKPIDVLKYIYSEKYYEWTESLGGVNNAELRTFIKAFRLF